MRSSQYLDPRELAAFVAIADKLSFRRAAALLHLTPPTLGRRLAALEKRHRVTLIARDSHDVRLTPEGQAFLPLARSLLQLLDSASGTLSDLATGASREHVLSECVSSRSDHG